MMEMFQKTKEKLDQWPLLKCEKTEQIDWFQKTILPQVIEISKQGDRLEELLVVDELFDIASEALEDAQLPEGVTQEGINQDQLEQDFKQYCKTILIRAVSSDRLAQPEAQNLPPEVQFIRPITFGMKLQSYVEQWDEAIGFTNTLRQTGCPVSFNFTEKKMLFGIAHLLSCLGNQQKIQTPNTNNLFTLDK